VVPEIRNSTNEREPLAHESGREGRVVESLGASQLTWSTTDRGAAGVLWAALHSLVARRERTADHLYGGRGEVMRLRLLDRRKVRRS
jgi:hypothetical protein